MKNSKPITNAKSEFIASDGTEFTITISHAPYARINSYTMTKQGKTIIENAACPRDWTPRRIFRYHVKDEIKV